MLRILLCCMVWWLEPQVRIYLYARADRHAQVPFRALGEKPLSGQLVVFINRKRIKINIL